MKVTILHPNFGIGGAERLILDAAIAMKSNDYEVEIVTNRYREDHCFQESKLFSIREIDVFPRSIVGFAVAFCAYVRMCLAAIYICCSMKQDFILCDSISVCLIIFRLFRFVGICNAKLVFYCHFPDQLLTDRRTLWKTVYRYAIDSAETWSIAMADAVCVNSIFTRNIALKTFPNLRNEQITVLYPTINTQFFDHSPSLIIDQLPDSKYLFASINRFERKKNIGLALEAFAELKQLVDEHFYNQCLLVIAGGYDCENEENVFYHNELKEYAIELEIPAEKVVFFRSPNDELKVELLRRATAVLYTPENEHFGIVPIEAMYMKKCVIAVNSGGPMESIVDNETGFLVEPCASAFAVKMISVMKGTVDGQTMGLHGHQRVLSMFTIESFGCRLSHLFKSL